MEERPAHLVIVAPAVISGKVNSGSMSQFFV